MDNQIENAGRNDDSADGYAGGFDYTRVNAVARIALYDDLRSAPRVTEIQPATTAEFIENLASKIYEQARSAGGTIPYTVVREVTENFIHARFTEIIVSILDNGNTVRFADQGPGISQKEKAQLPGFTSAVEPMKHYIRGVGSGLPIVKEYLDLSHGTITIEDNLGTGAVVTISMIPDAQPKAENPMEPAFPQGGYPGAAPYPYPHQGYPRTSQAAPYHPVHDGSNPDPRMGVPSGWDPARYGSDFGKTPLSLVPPLNQRERDFLPIFLSEGALGVTDISRLTGVAPSSTYVTLSKLEEAGLIEKTVGQKRILTDLGYQVANSL